MKKEPLLNLARDNHAPREVLDLVQRLPGEQYSSPKDVMKAFGEVV